MLIYILLLLPVPLIFDFQLNLTSWLFPYLSNLFLKVFTDSALTTTGNDVFVAFQSVVRFFLKCELIIAFSIVSEIQSKSVE